MRSSWRQRRAGVYLDESVSLDNSKTFLPSINAFHYLAIISFLLLSLLILTGISVPGLASLALLFTLLVELYVLPVVSPNLMLFVKRATHPQADNPAFFTIRVNSLPAERPSKPGEQLSKLNCSDDSKVRKSIKYISLLRPVVWNRS